MKIEVSRQACCAQDDQLGPLTIDVELSDNATIQDLARAIGEAKFLQFTSSHHTINCYSDKRLLFSIPALSIKASKVEYFINKYDVVLNHISDAKIKCLWPKELW